MDVRHKIANYSRNPTTQGNCREASCSRLQYHGETQTSRPHDADQGELIFLTGDVNKSQAWIGSPKRKLFHRRYYIDGPWVKFCWCLRHTQITTPENRPTGLVDLLVMFNHFHYTINCFYMFKVLSLPIYYHAKISEFYSLDTRKELQTI